MRVAVLSIGCVLVCLSCGGADDLGGGGAGGASGSGGASAGGALQSLGGLTSSGGAALAHGGAPSAGGASGGRASASGGGDASGGTASAGNPGGGAGNAGAGALFDCDPRKILCKRVAPVCDAGSVPSVAGSCYGECVRVELCACDEPMDCPNSETYTCHRSAAHCGPYVN